MSDIREPITILIWADNSPGVLLRLASLFSRRKINIDSLTVSETEQVGIARFTVVIVIEPVLAATIGRQIERMVEVRRVIVSLESWVVHREVALMRALLSPDDEKQLLQRYPNLRVVDRSPQGALLECSGTTEEISALSRDLRGGGLRELVRSGRVAVTLTGDYQHDLSRSLHELRPAAEEGPEF
jgi:acetolactate synthase-1/3 small subunit